MSKRKRYDDKFRASAVVMLEAAGYPDTKGALQHVADHLGVPAMTLSRWFKGTRNPPPHELVTEKRGDLLDSLKALAHQLVEAMPGKIEDANLQQSGTVLGIVLDKVLLLEGKATERVDHTGLTRDERISRISALLDRRGTGGATSPPRSTDD
jgi:transposase-like protein